MPRTDPRAALALLLALVPACPKSPPGDTTGDAPGTSSSSGAPEGSSDPSADPTGPDPTTGAPGTTTDSTTTGEGGSTFSPPPDMGGELNSCYVYDPGDDCPEGQKCSMVGFGSAREAFQCVPLARDPARPFGPCTDLSPGVEDGLDTCPAGQYCWNVHPGTDQGACLDFCKQSESDPLCPGGTTCALGGSIFPSLCIPSCDPLAQDCPAGERCSDNAGYGPSFVCIVADAGPPAQVFEPCEAHAQCDAGLACLPHWSASECDPETFGCCLPFCDLAAPNTCPGAGQSCQPFDFVDPPELAHVGLCALPP